VTQSQKKSGYIKLEDPAPPPWWQFGRSTASLKFGKNCDNGIAKSKSSYWYNRYCPTESKISKEKEANPEPISYRIMC
jgi:hypothetical protein